MSCSGVGGKSQRVTSRERRKGQRALPQPTPRALGGRRIGRLSLRHLSLAVVPVPAVIRVVVLVGVFALDLGVGAGAVDEQHVDFHLANRACW